jgi:hypothetical protein
MVLTVRYSKRRLEQRAFASRQSRGAQAARPRSSSWSASPRSTELKKAAPRADAEQRLALALTFDGSTPALFELGSLGELVGKSARASSQQHHAQLQHQEQRRRRAGSVHSDSGLVLAVQHQRKRVLFRILSDEELSDEEAAAGPGTPPRTPPRSSPAGSAPGTPESAAAHADAEPKSNKKKKLSSPAEELESLLAGLVSPPQTPPLVPEQKQQQQLQPSQAADARAVPDSDSLAGDGARRARRREVESGVALLFDSLFPACCEGAGADTSLVLGPAADRVKEALRSALAQSAQPAAQASMEDAGTLLDAAALTQLICNALRACEGHDLRAPVPQLLGSRSHGEVPEVRLCKAVLERFPAHGLAFTNALLVCVADSMYVEAGPGERGGCPASRGGPERGGAAPPARCAAQLGTLCDLAQALMAKSVSAQSFDLFAALFGRTRRILQRGGGHTAAADLAARALNSCFAVLVRAAPVEVVQRVVARMLRSWPPLGTAASMLYLDLVDTFLHLCPVRVLADSPTQVKLFQLLAQQLDSPNAAHARRVCEVIGAPHVIMNYIAPFERVHVQVSTALFAASRGHWSFPLREMAEALFDELLDFR